MAPPAFVPHLLWPKALALSSLCAGRTGFVLAQERVHPKRAEETCEMPITCVSSGHCPLSGDHGAPVPELMGSLEHRQGALISVGMSCR